MERRAIQFVEVLARQLADEKIGCISNWKMVFKGAVAILPSRKLQREISKYMPLYYKRFHRNLRKFKHPGAANSPPQTSLCFGASDKVVNNVGPYNLVSSHIQETDGTEGHGLNHKETLNLLALLYSSSTEDEYSQVFNRWRCSLGGESGTAGTSGTLNQECTFVYNNSEPPALAKLMDHAVQMLSADVETILQSQNINRATEFLPSLHRFMVYFHMKQKLPRTGQQHLEKDINFRHWITTLFSFYLDLHALIARSNWGGAATLARKTLSKACVVLDGPDQITSALLLLNNATQADAHFLLRFLQYAIRCTECSTSLSYLKYLLVCRLAKSILQSSHQKELSELLQHGISARPPSDLATWLTDHCPEVAGEILTHVKAGQPTIFLLQVASHDLCQRLTKCICKLEGPKQPGRTTSYPDDDAATSPAAPVGSPTEDILIVMSSDVDSDKMMRESTQDESSVSLGELSVSEDDHPEDAPLNSMDRQSPEKVVAKSFENRGLSNATLESEPPDSVINVEDDWCEDQRAIKNQNISEEKQNVSEDVARFLKNRKQGTDSPQPSYSDSCGLISPEDSAELMKGTSPGTKEFKELPVERISGELPREECVTDDPQKTDTNYGSSDDVIIIEEKARGTRREEEGIEEVGRSSSKGERMSSAHREIYGGRSLRSSLANVEPICEEKESRNGGRCYTELKEKRQKDKSLSRSVRRLRRTTRNSTLGQSGCNVPCKDNVVLDDQKKITDISPGRSTSALVSQREGKVAIDIVSDSESEQEDVVRSDEEFPRTPRTRYLRSLGSLTSSSMSSLSSDEETDEVPAKTSESGQNLCHLTGQSLGSFPLSPSPLSSERISSPSHSTSRIVTRSRYRVPEILDETLDKEKGKRPAKTGIPQRGHSLGSVATTPVSPSSSSEMISSISHSTSRIVTRSRCKVPLLLDENQEKGKDSRTAITGSPQRGQSLETFTASSPAAHSTCSKVTRSRYRVPQLLDETQEKEEDRPVKLRSPQRGQSLWSVSASPLSPLSSSEVTSSPSRSSSRIETRSSSKVPPPTDSGIQDGSPGKDSTNQKSMKTRTSQRVSSVSIKQSPRNSRLDYRKTESATVCLQGRYHTRSVKHAFAVGDLANEKGQSILTGNGVRHSPRLLNRSQTSLQNKPTQSILGQETSVKQCRRKLKMEETDRCASAEGTSPAKRPRNRGVVDGDSQSRRSSQRLSERE